MSPSNKKHMSLLANSPFKMVTKHEARSQIAAKTSGAIKQTSSLKQNKVPDQQNVLYP